MKKDVTPSVLAALVLVAMTAATVAAGHAPAPEVPPSLRLRMLAAEDARDSSPAGLAPLLEGLRDPDAETQRRAVRALGRFEQPALITHIIPMLSAAEASVRAEAANALAQAFHAEPNGAAGAVIARAALAKETHPLVQGALLLALGRLKYTTLDEWRAAEVLLCDTLFPDTGGPARGVVSPAVLLNGLRGMLFLARQAPDNRPLHQVTVAALTRLARPQGDAADSAMGPTTGAGARIRVLALQVLRAGHVSGTGPFERARLDPDPAVRRVAVSPVTAGPVLPAGFLDALAATARARGQSTANVERMRKQLIATAEEGLRKQLEDDPSPTVRLEALRGYLQQSTPNCALVVRRIDDASVHVALAAIDGIATTCAADRDARGRIQRIAAGNTPLKAKAPWHGRAHALVVLAQIDRATALPHVRTAARDQNPWLRTYAARALGHALAPATARDAGDVALLESLARDANVNVATAAIESLHSTLAHAAHAIYIAALARDDRAMGGAASAPTGYELVLAAVKALKDTAHVSEAEAAMLAALDRLSADRRETSRDPRMAILAWLTAHGGAPTAERLRTYVSDFDPSVARSAAAFVSARTGTTVPPQPRPLLRAPLPTDSELAALDTTTVELQMADGGRVEIALIPQEAPLNAFRFVKLAERGYFDGLTIHRLVANFVAQGGSPGANEYSGDGPFSRDEVGMASNADGTVGVSTRGRDTGDGQFYVNINDNTRLDHAYTVFGRIASGRDVVDRWLEGDVIVKARVIAR